MSRLSRGRRELTTGYAGQPGFRCAVQARVRDCAIRYPLSATRRATDYASSLGSTYGICRFDLVHAMESGCRVVARMLWTVSRGYGGRRYRRDAGGWLALSRVLRSFAGRFERVGSASRGSRLPAGLLVDLIRDGRAAPSIDDWPASPHPGTVRAQAKLDSSISSLLSGRLSHPGALTSRR